MKNSKVFYMLFTVIFVVVNVVAYLFLFAPLLEQYAEQQEQISARKQQQEEINTTKQKLAEYKVIKPLYIKNSKLYEKLIEKDFKSSKIKIFFNKLGKKLGTDMIYPREIAQKKIGGEEEDGEEEISDEEVVAKSASFSIDTMLTFAQLNDFLTFLIRNSHLFLVRTFSIRPMDEQGGSGNDMDGNGNQQISEKLLKIILTIDYIYFLPPVQTEE